jgi:hypothetical protein
MFRSSRRKPWFNAIFYAVIAFIICSFVPMWQVIHHGGWNGSVTAHTFWLAMLSTIDPSALGYGAVGFHPKFLRAGIITQICMLLAATIGYFTSRRQEMSFDSADTSAPN